MFTGQLTLMPTVLPATTVLPVGRARSDTLDFVTGHLVSCWI
jgi:hypothetical protein